MYRKNKAEVFDGPQIRQLTKDTTFGNSMNEAERKPCTSFLENVGNFLGIRKAEKAWITFKPDD